MKALKRGATILLSIVLWAVILLAALFAFTTLATKNSSQVASLAGFTPLSVVSDSMAPTFNAGDLIVIRRCDPAELQEGDIITFHAIINNEYALNTHRITEIQDQNGTRSYVTKGDNNAIADIHMIADGDIVGRYVGRLPGFGKVVEFLSSSTGFLLVIVLPLLLFFIYQVYHLVTVSIDLKKALAVESVQESAQADSLLADAAKAKEEAARAKAEAEAARAEAEAALAEARRLREEAGKQTEELKDGNHE
ncbi:MAG: signal peptidase I [Faecousia sp.]